MSTGLRQALAKALTSELNRQLHGEAAKIDINALVDVVEASIVHTGHAAEGKRPDELNSTNDD